jgi:hypothetical protein
MKNEQRHHGRAGGESRLGQGRKKKVAGSLGSSAEIQVIKRTLESRVIIAKGNHPLHFINGKQTVDVMTTPTANGR